MKKTFISLIALVIGYASLPTGASALEFNTHYWCAGNTGLLYWGNLVRTPKLWWCGEAGDNCQGKNPKDAQIMKHGQTILSQEYHKTGDTYYCCVNKTTGANKFVTKADWNNPKTEKKTEYFENDTKCQWVQTTDACGNVSGTKCTTPDPTQCGEGKVFRNGACVSPSCPEGQAFESATSNTCVSCTLTSYQGVDGNGLCVKCSQDKQLWDNANKNCVSKTDTSATKQYSKNVMKKCYACPNIATYQECIDLFNKPESQRESAENATRLVDDCKLKSLED